MQAKVGSLYQSSGMTARPGPAFVAAPYCSASVAELAIHGALAALTERVKSQRGQHVQSDMAQALGAHDTWNGMVAHGATSIRTRSSRSHRWTRTGYPLPGILFRLMTAILRTAAGSSSRRRRSGFSRHSCGRWS